MSPGKSDMVDEYFLKVAVWSIICLLIGSPHLFAVNYYISATGSDTSNGLTPAAAWQTISTVNAHFTTFAPGDSVLFKRGDTFYGTITISRSGTNGKPITISAYGTGARPVITGFTTISGWTNEGGGIYSKVITSLALTNMVTIDGKQVGMGRYPDTGFLTYEGVPSANSITDNGLGTSTNWTGAGIAIRKNDWTLDRSVITNHTGDVLTFTNLGTTYTPTANFGYFIMNDLRTLTTYGEWYHNIATGKFYMFFGLVDPTSKMVQVATLNNQVYDSGSYDYITLDNLNLIGAINDGAYFTSGDDYCNLQNCDISFCGNKGIDLGGGIGCIVDNNTIRDCNSHGIYSNYGSLSVIINNMISNIGLIPGQSYFAQGNDGIYLPGNGGIISYNTIKNTGYNGICIRYSGASSVTYNYIDSVCLVLNDGGGIYTGGTNSSRRVFDHNIITNVIGNGSGAIRQTSLAEGIYLDEYASNILVTNNVVANSNNSGIKLHKAHDNTITDNTTFNCQRGIDYLNSSGSNIRNNSLRRNTFFAKSATQYASVFSSVTDDINLFGTADSNYYARPLDDNLTFTITQPSAGWQQKSLAAWQTFTNQDAHSQKSPIAVTDVNDIRFEFNATKAVKTIALDAKYICLNGKIVEGSVTLQPYCSVILMKYSTPTAINALPNRNIPIVNVFPNPVTNELMIEVEQNNSRKGFDLINSSGRSVLKGSLFEKTTVNVTNFSPGIYFLKIEQGNSCEVKKILKI